MDSHVLLKAGRLFTCRLGRERYPVASDPRLSSPVHCRVKPVQIKRRRCAAPGPVSALPLSLPRPARRTPGHLREIALDRYSSPSPYTGHATGQHATAAHSPYGRRTYSSRLANIIGSAVNARHAMAASGESPSTGRAQSSSIFGAAKIGALGRTARFNASLDRRLPLLQIP